ncbi:hypothetical protein EDI_266780 [Entamoeba dispar SAW760]|uniref:Leucine rich repeat containing protein BspA family protein n=1 Tax=Entamoeba dispar (strain ATCC PRA-260 / SAW760) TaxID=370354 RepID=B0EU78_ENTDS|nr:uncharacterized protein EDI_266780 [Entamoeba dispar SAW760]EDR21914.1 hypothetical protein EDI_266780 [Entamoeba dispar SAW760]|eukprot:EDR21914.1 hypothetical protein EDI_266780 [Entamoeba dispar SAW760]
MKLGYNEIMIVSIYFNDINDFINLEIGIKRFQGNMERFHFNPIPLNERSRKLFPNIETFHIYNENDEIFNDGKIFKKVIWYLVDYSTHLKEKEAGNICKNIEYTKSDREEYGNIVPHEVKSLGDQCFKHCTSLKSINIPTTISEIGQGCFRGCSSLKSISIPSSVSKIGYYCFFECTSLTSFTIPTTISIIGHGFFCKCMSLKSVNMPSVSRIGYCCFGECTSLTSIVLENIQFISEKRIFMNKPVLISFEIPYNLQKINGENIEKKDINEFIIPTIISELSDSCFSKCVSLTSINIPTTISELGTWCFSHCSSLKSINIPSSISKLGYECFSDCSSLTSINMYNLQYISKERIFMSEPVLFSIEIPKNLQIINGKNVEKKDINEFIIPSSITKLDRRCFYWCESLTSITIPTTISEIGYNCFYCCTSLKSITIPSSISELGYCCFKECYSLTSINIPSSISELGYCCFNNCSSLTSINIPSSITLFGEYCFCGCGCTEELKKNKTIPRGSFEHIQ